MSALFWEYYARLLGNLVRLPYVSIEEDEVDMLKPEKSDLESPYVTTNGGIFTTTDQLLELISRLDDELEEKSARIAELKGVLLRVSKPKCICKACREIQAVVEDGDD